MAITVVAINDTMGTWRERTNDIIDELNNGVGDRTTLTTTDTTIVGAINELDTDKAEVDMSNVATDAISGDQVDGGTISNFASTGIDDNATATVLTIDSSNNVTVAGDLTVTGTYTTVLSETVQVQDNILELNSNVVTGSPTDGGIEVKRSSDGSATSAYLRYSEADRSWQFGTGDGNGPILGSTGFAGIAWSEIADEGTLTSAYSIDCGYGGRNVIKMTLGANIAIGANNKTITPGATFILIIAQDGTGNRVPTFGSSFKFPGGNAPTLSTGANEIDIISFVSDGSNLYGAIQNAFA
jgi:hypothetical protein